MTRRRGLFAFVAGIFGAATAKSESLRTIFPNATTPPQLDRSGFTREFTFLEKGEVACLVITDDDGKLLSVSHHGRTTEITFKPLDMKDKDK